MAKATTKVTKASITKLFKTHHILFKFVYSNRHRPRAALLGITRGPGRFTYNDEPTKWVRRQVTTALDWKPTRKCGYGLHAYDPSHDYPKKVHTDNRNGDVCRPVIVAVPRTSQVVKLRYGKVKFKSCRVIGLCTPDLFIHILKLNNTKPIKDKKTSLWGHKSWDTNYYFGWGGVFNVCSRPNHAYLPALNKHFP